MPLAIDGLIDSIDELVDAALDKGEPLTGYNYGDPQFPKCPHCQRHWHYLRLTERVARMYSRGHYDEEYVAAEDDSRVVCEGSEFIGPQRPYGVEIAGVSISVGNFTYDWNPWVSNYLTELQATYTYTFEWSLVRASGWQRVGALVDEPTWNWDEWRSPPPAEIPCTGTEITIRFGPENWAPICDPHYPIWLYLNVGQLWNEFTKDDFPVPESPGYDFSKYDTFVRDDDRDPSSRRSSRGVVRG